VRQEWVADSIFHDLMDEQARTPHRHHPPPPPPSNGIVMSTKITTISSSRSRRSSGASLNIRPVHFAGREHLTCSWCMKQSAHCRGKNNSFSREGPGSHLLPVAMFDIPSLCPLDHHGISWFHGRNPSCPSRARKRVSRSRSRSRGAFQVLMLMLMLYSR
jgi:hypothetical protein